MGCGTHFPLLALQPVSLQGTPSSQHLHPAALSTVQGVWSGKASRVPARPWSPGQALPSAGGGLFTSLRLDIAVATVAVLALTPLPFSAGAFVHRAIVRILPATPPAFSLGKHVALILGADDNDYSPCSHLHNQH